MYMSKKIHTEAVDSLFDAVLSLKNREECYLFFEDVCTINEILSLSQRFEVAKMLKDKRTYLEMCIRDRQYLPAEILGSHFYEPTENGYEKNIRDYLERIRRG